MDPKTIRIYDEKSAQYAENWISQPEPTEIYRRIRQFFKKGRLSADLGSGSGRDVAWLNANGYPAQGFDASDGLIQAARNRFPGLKFERAQLPSLQEIQDQSFDQILCETVLMHLPESEHQLSVQNILRILKTNGVLLMSWRMAESGPESRDGDGRLYSKVDFKKLFGNSEKMGIEILDHQIITSPSSGKQIEELVIQKN